MALVRWDPFRELEDVSTRLERFFGRVNPRNMPSFAKRGEWSPLVDISENDREYLVNAELPDVDRNELKVEVERGALRIHGERNEEMEEKGEKRHRVERSYGSFTRSFALPDDVDDSKVTAEYKDGVLTVHLPKGEHPRSHAVDVKVGM